ncbi:PolC-type DNA polymerase III [Erysipelothrix urinaevulpis]|uniref:PolC-type DNA polymerase III n=1 Tax=Erysipelothrix urinaevulpis TaxID=2683717 RepID=UPI001359163B|nr:PolC-type DNA polymerase III [Erysipelothrix urinaevulpis]
MKDLLEKLKVPIDQQKELENVRLLSAIYDQDKAQLMVSLFTHDAIFYKNYEMLMKAIEAYTHTEVRLLVSAETCTLDFTNLSMYLDYCVNRETLNAMRDVTLQVNGDIKLMCLNKHHKDQVEEELPFLKKAMQGCGINLELLAVLEEHKKENLTVKVKKEYKPQALTKTQTVDRTPRRRSKKEQYQDVALDHLQTEAQFVAIVGEIFKVDVRETRTGNFLVKYGIHNGKSALMAMEFVEKEDEILKKGKTVKVYGHYIYEARFDKDFVFQIHQYDLVEGLFDRFDRAEEKRVEFHLHTNKSDMDGVSDVTEYLDQAFEWKMPGFVITDHGGVQSFPKAYRHLQGLRKQHPDHEFKLGYGLEMNLVDEDLQIVRQAQKRSLHTGNYIVFDLETTGLSAYYDEIIEFGAVRIVNGKVIDKMQMFVKPEETVKPFIQELTGISNADLSHAAPIDKAIDDILEFIQDDTLVAHNAGFDLDFLQETMNKLNRSPLTNPVIDTLDFARVLYSDRRSYRLGSIARLLKIGYDEGVAHRADYDAEVLSLVFLEMLRHQSLKELDCITDLQKLSDSQAFAKLRAQHVNVIAKNQDGLKSLYELVSISHTKYLASSGKSSKGGEEFLAEPRIIRSELDARRENLLIGAGCTNSEIFELASNKGQAALKTAMSFYDYVEVMPLNLYSHLLERNAVASEARLIEIIQRIISTANELGIPVIGASDVHYNHPNQKMLRDVYIHSQGIGGTRHPLFIFNEERRLRFQAPNQHLRSTDEMLNDMAYLGEEQAYRYVITNPKELFAQIEEVAPVPKGLYTPSLDNSDTLLKEIVYRNAEKIYGNPLPEIVEERIVRELKSIIGHGYGVIYYISHLLVKRSLEDGYLVGSRGSVGSSFVATLSEITEVNPLIPHYICEQCHHTEFFTEGEYSSGYDLPAKDCPSCHVNMLREGQDIPFETFLGFEGDKVPDIDLNFSGDYQEHAHAYTKEIFGEDYVFRAGTISTVAEKTAYGYVLGYQESMKIESENKSWKEFLASGAEGVKRTTGQHPGGIIVIPSDMDVHDFTPIQYPANNPNSSWYTTHYEFHDIDDNVLKLDILGHVDPTAMKLLEEMTGVDIHTVPMNDPKTISLFSSTEALGVDERKYFEKTGGLGLPEFGTPFVRRMLEATLPNKFSDLVRISGLSHGTDVWANNAETLIKDGLELGDVIACRDDIMVYLMQHGLPHKTSFDIMESVRKGRGLRDEWIKVMRDNDVPEWYIDSCIKIKYMFPKAHAAAYVMMAIRVAWFKVYYPLAYYAVYFTLRVNAYELETMTAATETIAHRLNSINQRLRQFETMRDVSIKEKNLIDTLEVTLEMNHRGFKINPLSLENSHATQFILDPQDDEAILPPFNVVDGLGNSVAQNIVKARDEEMFISKEDMMRRAGVSSTLIKKLDELNVTKHLQDSNQMSLF